MAIVTVVCVSACARDTVSFPTPDHGVVYADIYGKGTTALVLAHGGRFDKESWRPQAERFADEGYLVLALDFRGRGNSVGGPNWNPNVDRDYGVHHDVVAAVNYLRQSGVQEIAIVGASFGGWASARAVNELDSGVISKLVVIASPIDSPDLLTVPTLFITSRGDFRGNGIPRLPEIKASFDEIASPKQLVVLDGDAHAQYLFRSDQAERLMFEILEFLRDGSAMTTPDE